MRNNDRIDRDELIRRIAMLVGPPHIVDLNTPELYIIVEIFKVSYGELKQKSGLFVCNCRTAG